MSDQRIISDDDFNIVDAIYTKIIESGQTAESLEGLERVVFLVENYNQEINSGLDFIQWYRWAEPFQLTETPDVLATVGLTLSRDICVEALRISFPEGLPETSEEMENVIDSLEDDEEKQAIREKLQSLALEQEDQNYNLTTGLANWIRSQSNQ